MSTSQYFPEPTEDAPLGSPQYLKRSFFPWPHENDATDEAYSGQPMARIGLRMSFYFRDADTSEIRDVLTTIVEQYIEAADGRIRRYIMDGDKRQRFATESELPDIALIRQRASDLRDGWSINLSAETESQYASPWSLATLADGTGYLLVHFPLTYFVGGQPGSMRTLFQRWCSALKVEHAYGGLGFILPTESGNIRSAMRRIGPYAMRFVGLDADLPSTTLDWCRNGIRCVNWLTAVNSSLLERVGGEAAVLKQAGPPVTAMPYANGSIFVAGESPEIGDAEAGIIPAAYVAIGRALRPIRAEYPNSIFTPPPGYEAPPGYTARFGWGMAKPHELALAHYAQRWLARFDGE